MLTLHHLQIAQSERIVWLLEELGISYELVTHIRAPLLAPESLTKVPGNIMGRAPFLHDSENGAQLGESGAIADYIIWKYGQGRLAAKPNDAHFADYLFWFHSANGSLQPAFLTSMFLAGAEVPQDSAMGTFAEGRLQGALKLLDDRLRSNKWLAGDEFTAADIMSVYPLTTQRYYGPQTSLAAYPSILRWLKDCAARPAYQRAMEKGDPEMKLLLDAEPPKSSLLGTEGVNATFWKK